MLKPEKFDKYDWNYKDAIQIAEDNDFLVLQSRPGLLLLDLDNPEALAHYETHLPLVARDFDLLEVSRYTSQSGKGTHIVLSCAPIKDMNLRIALQAVLGSDRKREALALRMAKQGIENPSWLFRPPQDQETTNVTI